MKKVKVSEAKPLTVDSTSATIPPAIDKRLSAVKKKIKKIQDADGPTRFTVDIQEEVIDIHYKSSMTAKRIADIVGVSDVTVGYWKKKVGKEKTHVLYGTTTRNDIRTKCLAVKDYKEDNRSKEHLAEQYHVGKSTITSWINRYEEKYKKYLELPDGVTTIAKDERLVFGDQNINEVREFMMLQQDELRDMIQQMQKHGIMANAIRQAEKRCLENEEEIDTLQKAADIIKKSKK